MQKLLLQALIVADGSLGLPRLAELLYGRSGPGPAGNVAGYVYRIRKQAEVLDGAASEVLVTVRLPGGGTEYRLPAGYDLDADRFRRDAEAASKMFRLGQLHDAYSGFSAALALWRPPPLREAAATGRSWARPYIDDLTNTHRTAAIGHLTSAISLGHVREAAAAAERLATVYRDEGEIQMLRAVALYRSSRPTAAARVLRSWAAVLTRTGAIPGTRFSGLQQAILDGSFPMSGPLDAWPLARPGAAIRV